MIHYDFIHIKGQENLSATKAPRHKRTPNKSLWNLEILCFSGINTLTLEL